MAVEHDGTWFVNGRGDNQDFSRISEEFRASAEFFSNYLDVPFGDAPVLMEFTSVEPFRAGRRWGFATWPTIAMAGSTTEELAASLTEESSSYSNTRSYLAHESAHYYFGTVQVPIGPLSWILIESTAEFLSWQYIRSVYGEDAYQDLLALHFTAVIDSNESYIPLFAVTASEQIGTAYRYSYAPLMLAALELRAGSDAVRRLLAKALYYDGAWDWGQLTQIAMRAGITESIWNQWREECMVENPAVSCVADFTAI